MNKRNVLLAVPLCLSLISASSSNYNNYDSKIKFGNIVAKKRLVDYSSKTITTISNVKKNTVASLTFNYEMYQMYKGTELYKDYIPGFILLYQADIYVNNAVEYKGGIGNWFDGKHAGFLNYIDITAKFDGIDYTGNSYQCPGYGDDNVPERGPMTLRGVTPTLYMYTQKSSEYNKQSTYNQCGAVLDSNSGGRFQQCPNIFTNSYYYGLNAIEKDFNIMNEFDDRLNASIYSKREASSDKKSLKFTQKFTYNRKIFLEKGTNGYFPNVENVSNGLYSGPCTNGKDDDTPFNFTFYGAFGVESNVAPSKVTIDLKLDTFHGSTTYLDKFESNASTSIVINL